MVRRIVFTLPKQVLEKHYGKVISGSSKAKYNINPGTKMIARVEGDDFLNQVSWGLIPYNSKAIKDYESLANISIAQIKDVVTRNSKRCIIPASGFVTWGEKEEPVYATFKRTPHFAFAGICESWDLGTGKQIQSFGIISHIQPSPLAYVSEQFPICMTYQDARAWLSNEEISVEDTSAFAIDPENLQITQLSKDIIDPAKEGPGLVKKGNSVQEGENFSLF